MERKRLNTDVAPDVQQILDAAGISTEGARQNKRVTEAILSWRACYLTQAGLMLRLHELLRDYPSIARPEVRRKRLTREGEFFAS